MFATLKAHWHDLRRGRPGHRFQDRQARNRREHRSKTWPQRLLQPAAAVLLLIAGIVLCFIPGPGLPLVAIGAALLADHSHTMARMMDWLEWRIRKVIRRIWSSQPA